MFGLVPSSRGKQQGDLVGRGPERFPRDFADFFGQLMNRWMTPWQDEGDLGRLWDLDLDDRENEIVVRAELPGFEPNEIDVQLNDHLLTLQAEHTQENQPEGGAYERRSSSFRRTITLPQGIDAEKAQASYKNGVLEMHLPKTEQAKGRRISVQAQSTPSLGSEKQGSPKTSSSTSSSSSTTAKAGTAQAASSYSPGSSSGGPHAGGQSAADVQGGGAGGDIDNPDISGRGTTKGATAGNR